MSDLYPLGKLPHDVLAALLARYPVPDPRVIVGARPGLDAAIIDLGASHLLVAKTDPITFATEEIGWYAVNINANDIACTGGVPLWFMATLLLPENTATPALVEKIFDQIGTACHALGVSVVGGHTEITYGIDRPIVVGAMLGLVEKGRMITAGGAQPGDMLIVTKGVPVEATAIIAREKAGLLRDKFAPDFLTRCANYLYTPGLSVVRDASIAVGAGRVHAMHDPTEGGLATGLWEMAEVSGKRLHVNCAPAILADGAVLCTATGLDPLGAIASGALLMAVHPDDAQQIMAALHTQGIQSYLIGHVEEGPPAVVDMASGDRLLPRPARDEIARLFESEEAGDSSG